MKESLVVEALIEMIVVTDLIEEIGEIEEIEIEVGEIVEIVMIMAEKSVEDFLAKTLSG
jgi:hypothetical protein